MLDQRERSFGVGALALLAVSACSKGAEVSDGDNLSSSTLVGLKVQTFEPVIPQRRFGPAPVFDPKSGLIWLSEINERDQVIDLSKSIPDFKASDLICSENRDRLEVFGADNARGEMVVIRGHVVEGEVKSFEIDETYRIPGVVNPISVTAFTNRYFANTSVMSDVYAVLDGSDRSVYTIDLRAGKATLIANAEDHPKLRYLDTLHIGIPTGDPFEPESGWVVTATTVLQLHIPTPPRDEVNIWIGTRSDRSVYLKKL